MSYIKTKKELDQGRVSPLYLLYGSQTFLMEDIVQSVIKHTVGSEQDPNIYTYSLQEVSLDVVIEEAETYPFFGGKKIVIVKDFFLSTSQKSDSKLEHDISKLEKYIEQPSPEAVLILLCPTEKLDARKKITKALNKQAIVVDCSPLDEKTISIWLEEQAKNKGFTFSSDGKEQILARVGPELLMLVSEMDKLALYVGKGGEVDHKVVDLLVARSLEQDVFALIDYAIGRKMDKALLIYHDLIKQREEPLKLLALIARQLRIYYQVKELSRQSYSQNQIAGQLKIHPYVVKLASQQINRFDDRRLLRLLESAADTDYAIKSGKMDKVLAVELLLMKLSTLSP